MKIGNKIIVIGTSCVGKTTFAAKLSQKTKFKHFDLDDLHWLPNWIEKDDSEFIAEINERILPEDKWIVSGNYFSLVKNNLWKDADTIVWLNFPLSTILFRYAKRTYRRIVLKEPCCNGNFENFRHSFFSSENLFLWILKTHSKRKIEIKKMRKNEFKSKKWLEIKTHKAADKFLKSV